MVFSFLSSIVEHMFQKALNHQSYFKDILSELLNFLTSLVGTLGFVQEKTKPNTGLSLI